MIRALVEWLFGRADEIVCNWANATHEGDDQ